MAFAVVPARRVLQQISKLSQNQQWWYAAQIVPILTASPYPTPDFAPIQPNDPDDGVNFNYFDGIAPLVLRYKVLTFNGPGEGGWVWIWRAIAPTDL
jgi:hypothetical protein